jgi:hypothetical protein
MDEQEHVLLFDSLLPMPEALRGTASPSPLETGTVRDKATREHRPLTDAEREHLEALERVHGHADWLSWQHERWGVKWGDCHTTMTDSHDEWLEFEFWTPWDPPLAALTAIAEMFPSLSFRMKYDEPNCELLGIVNWSGGKLVRHRAA